MKKNVRRLAVIVLILIAAATASLYIWGKHNHDNRTIKVSGNIEGNDVRISFRVMGQIEELIADEGTVLSLGQTVARLNTDELIKTRNEAAASLKATEYEYELAKVDYVRAENLLTVGSISAQKRDGYKTKADSLKSEVDRLRASLELAETRLGFAELASPLNGYVLTKSAEQGEVVQVGAPVFTAIDLNDIWVTAYINETDVGRVKLNQKAYVKTDAYPLKKYNGWISYISQQAEFTPKYIQTTEERVKYVYRIKVRVDNSTLELKPGMPADAYITVE